jgi:hypothetical protein
MTLSMPYYQAKDGIVHPSPTLGDRADEKNNAICHWPRWSFEYRYWFEFPV